MIEQQDSIIQTQHIDSIDDQHDAVTIVLTADNHLGHDTFGQYKSEERLQRLRDAFQQAVTFAIGQKVDFFIQAGGLFSTQGQTEKDRDFVEARLHQLKQAGIAVVTLDEQLDTSIQVDTATSQDDSAQSNALNYVAPALQKEGETEPLLLDAHEQTVAFWSLNASDEQAIDVPLAQFCVANSIEKAALSLLIAHVPVEGVSDLGDGIVHVEIKQSSIEQQHTFNYILAGCSQTYQQQRIGETEVVLAGATHSPDNASWSKTHALQPGFVYLGLTRDRMQWCNHIVVDALHTQQVHVPIQDLWNDDSDTTPTERILERLEASCDEETMILLHLEGEVTRRQFHQIDMNRLRRYGEEHCFSLTIDDSNVSLVSNTNTSLSTASKRFSPRDELIAVVEEWIADTHDEFERTALLNTKEELLAALDESRGKR